jgi:hypothetical protein
VSPIDDDIVSFSAHIASQRFLVVNSKYRVYSALIMTIGLVNPAWAYSQAIGKNVPKKEAAAHTPAVGSAERNEIMDALREDQKSAFEGKKLVFKVHHLKVHNGWAWLDVTPMDDKGNALAEGGPNLLHYENSTWKVKDLSKVADDPDDPMGPEDASPGFIRNLRKVYPDVPTDIFPKFKK